MHIHGFLAKLKSKCTENMKPNYSNNLRRLFRSEKGNKDISLTEFNCRNNRPVYSLWAEMWTIPCSDWIKILKSCFKAVKNNFLI